MSFASELADLIAKHDDSKSDTIIGMMTELEQQIGGRAVAQVWHTTRIGAFDPIVRARLKKNRKIEEES